MPGLLAWEPADVVQQVCSLEQLELRQQVPLALQQLELEGQRELQPELVPLELLAPQVSQLRAQLRLERSRELQA